MPDLAARIAAVDPNRLVDLLQVAGFTNAGGRTGVYVRLTWPGQTGLREGSLVVPLDRTMADYPDLLGDTLLTLDDADHRGKTARSVLDALGGPLATQTQPADVPL